MTPPAGSTNDSAGIARVGSRSRSESGPTSVKDHNSDRVDEFFVRLLLPPGEQLTRSASQVHELGVPVRQAKDP